jgi:hypothetical protein
MIWISKKFVPGAAWAGDQGILERLQMALAASGNADYPKLLMALHESEGVDTVYIYVPNEYLARLFPGYQVVAEPKGLVASLLLGVQDDFLKYFKFQSYVA